jgi:hypothetical protein
MKCLVVIVSIVCATGCVEWERDPCAGGVCIVASDDARFLRLDDAFDDESQCPTDGLPNCHAVFDLCANGGFHLVLTDIAEEGLYWRDGERIVATTQPDATMMFEATLDERGQLQADAIGGLHPWRRLPLDEERAAEVESACRALATRPWFPQAEGLD